MELLEALSFRDILLLKCTDQAKLSRLLPDLRITFQKMQEFGNLRKAGRTLECIAEVYGRTEKWDAAIEYYKAAEMEYGKRPEAHASQLLICRDHQAQLAKVRDDPSLDVKEVWTARKISSIH